MCQTWEIVIVIHMEPLCQDFKYSQMHKCLQYITKYNTKYILSNTQSNIKKIPGIIVCFLLQE